MATLLMIKDNIIYIFRLNIGNKYLHHLIKSFPD